MADMTARFFLPNLAGGQAGKEVTHNEALALIDGLLHPLAETMALAVPPADPAPGRMWLVPAGAGGAWAGQGDRIALATDGGWRFATPTRAMSVWLADEDLPVQWTGSAWRKGVLAGTSVRCGGVQVVGARQPPIAAPTGGETVDEEVRATLEAVLGALRNHGLIAT